MKAKGEEIDLDEPNRLLEIPTLQKRPNGSSQPADGPTGGVHSYGQNGSPDRRGKVESQKWPHLTVPPMSLLIQRVGMETTIPKHGMAFSRHK